MRRATALGDTRSDANPSFITRSLRDPDLEEGLDLGAAQTFWLPS